MMSFALLAGSALAGDIFVVSNAEILTRLDTRDFTVNIVGDFGVLSPVYVQILGGSYNSIDNKFIISAMDTRSLYQIPINSIFEMNLDNFWIVNLPLQISTSALSFDPVTDTTIALGGNRSGAWDLFTGTLLFDPGVGFIGADWFDDGGYIVGREGTTGDFYRVEAGMTTRLAPTPPVTFYSTGGLAYDSDTRLFWWVAMPYTLLIEPQTWSLVGILHASNLLDGAGGSIDTVLPQTPELLVTGACPGTVYLTVVDATPGQHVQFASGTTPGTRTVRRGPCAGVQGDLQNPTPRFDLIANDYGIASTTIQATAPMCGAGLVQAIDVATCLTTSVRTIPDGPLMLSL